LRTGGRWEGGGGQGKRKEVGKRDYNGGEKGGGTREQNRGQGRSEGRGWERRKENRKIGGAEVSERGREEKGEGRNWQFPL